MLASLLLALLPLTSAHFILQDPPSVGFNDAKESEAPCGGFDFKDRTTITEWPLGGHPVGVVSTHMAALWQFRAALVDDPETFVDLIPNVDQSGLGNFCLENIPGHPDWVDKDVFFQLIQTAVDGKLYQCAAVKFVEGPAAAVRGSCRNGTDTTASYDPEYDGEALRPTNIPGTSDDSADSPAETNAGAANSETPSSAAQKPHEVSITGMLAVTIALMDYFFM